MYRYKKHVNSKMRLKFNLLRIMILIKLVQTKRNKEVLIISVQMISKCTYCPITGMERAFQRFRITSRCYFTALMQINEIQQHFSYVTLFLSTSFPEFFFLLLTYLLFIHTSQSDNRIIASFCFVKPRGIQSRGNTS